MKKSRKLPRAKPPLDLSGIGRRIRQLRGFDMTQAEFAERIGVTQGYLSALEHGKKEPGSAVLIAIQREFKKSIDWLLSGKDEEKK